jgi:N-acetyl-1-D-myo-inositol-2-amino-2-deoxy-alpha-D-glucopyranoside deacetylase
VLVVTAHPDDECLLAGGVLAACSAAGVATGVVCLTRGELGPIASAKLATPATLGDVRLGELRAACQELGVGFVKCFRRRDGELMSADVAALGRQLARVITRWRPQVVITFDEDGMYHHPDHVAVHHFTRRALAALDGSAARPWLYEAVWPADTTVELVEEMRGRGLPTDLWGLHPDGFGSYDLSDTSAIDVRPFAAQKLRALRCHRSQFGQENLFGALPEDLAERFLGVERFRRALPRRARRDRLAQAVARAGATA